MENFDLFVWLVGYATIITSTFFMVLLASAAVIASTQEWWSGMAVYVGEWIWRFKNGDISSRQDWYRMLVAKDILEVFKNYVKLPPDTLVNSMKLDIERELRNHDFVKMRSKVAPE